MATLIKALLNVVLIGAGCITCLMGLIVFAWSAGLHNGPRDMGGWQGIDGWLTIIVFTGLIEGFGALLMLLAGRLVGKPEAKG